MYTPPVPLSAGAPVVVYDANGRTVTRSKNLAGLLRVARKYPVASIEVQEFTRAGRLPLGILTIRWEGGLVGSAAFEGGADHAEDWVKARSIFKGLRVAKKNPHRAKKNPKDQAFYVYRVSLDRDGYAKSGQYFGAGAPLYRVEGDEDFYVRAGDMAGAKAQVKKKYPGAVFPRKNPDLSAYISAGKKAFAKGAASAVREAGEALARAEKAASEVQTSRAQATPVEALEVLAKQMGYRLVRANGKRKGLKLNSKKR